MAKIEKRPLGDGLDSKKAGTEENIYRLGAAVALGLNRFKRVAFWINPETNNIEMVHPEGWFLDQQRHFAGLAADQARQEELTASLDQMSEPEAVDELTKAGYGDEEISRYLEERDQRLERAQESS